MAGLVEGKWSATLPAAEEIKDGRFVRKDSLFRNHLSADPDSEFPAEAGRYQLWIAWSCPWASRTLAFRALKGLEDVIDLRTALPGMGKQGWTFPTDQHGHSVEGGFPLHRLYTTSVPDYTGKVTVPTLWDSERQTVVSNESADIIRMLNSAFDPITGDRQDFYPEALRSEIDHWNDFIYPRVNNGVYRAGFSTSQAAYDEAVTELFSALETLDEHLRDSRYLAGEYCTEADWRLFTTLVRFDVAYHGAFKCNLARIADFQALSHYLRELYQWPGIAATVHFERIKSDYYSIPTISPTGIVPAGPPVDLGEPHDRERLPGKGVWQREG
jgi:putative glutathione S-transferase